MLISGSDIFENAFEIYEAFLFENVRGFDYKNNGYYVGAYLTVHSEPYT